jgi:hypothetical protein
MVDATVPITRRNSCYTSLWRCADYNCRSSLLSSLIWIPNERLLSIDGLYLFRSRCRVVVGDVVMDGGPVMVIRARYLGSTAAMLPRYLLGTN